MNQEIDLQALQLSIYQDNFYSFFVDAWRELDTRPLQDSWLYKFLADSLQATSELVINRKPAQSVIINCPPSMGKTRIATEINTAYMLGRNPGLRIGICSFSLDTSNKMCGEVRRLMETGWYKKYFPESKLTDSRVSKITTIAGGGCESISPGSATTSKHFSVIICDDFASAGQASSATMNQFGIDYYENSLKSRIENLGCPFIWIGQKYHSGDIYSHILNKPGANYNHIVLPALLADNIQPGIETIREKYPEAYQCNTIDCVRMGPEAAKLLEENTNSEVWSSQYMQENLDLSTITYQREWIPLIDVADGIVLGQNKIRHCVIDPAAGGADETAILILFYADGALYLEASYFHTYGWTKAVPYLMGLLGKHGIGNKSKILVENTSSGPQLIAELLQANFNAIPVSHEGKGKQERMKDDAVLVPIMAKRFRVIQHHNAGKFLGQMCGPMKIRLQDGRDAGVYAVKHLMEGNNGNSFNLYMGGDQPVSFSKKNGTWGSDTLTNLKYSHLGGYGRGNKWERWDKGDYSS